MTDNDDFVPDAPSDGFVPDAPASAPPPPAAHDDFVPDNTAAATPPAEPETIFGAVTGAPRQIYEAGKNAVSSLWEKEKQSAEANAKDPSGVLTDWWNKRGDFAAAAAAPLAPVTNLLGAGVKAIAEPVAGLMAYGEQAIGEPLAKTLNPNAKLPTHEEVYEQNEPDVETALGLGIPKGFQGSKIVAPLPKPVPPAPKAGPLGVTLSEGQATGDLTKIQLEQAALDGSLGPDVQRRAQAFAEQQKRQIEEASSNVSGSMDKFGQNVVMSPNEAGEVVSDALNATEAKRAAQLQQRGEALRPKMLSDPLNAADRVLQSLRQRAATSATAQGSRETALAADGEAIRASLSPNGQILAANPQEAADIVSAGITRAEEMATADRDAKFEAFGNAPGTFNPDAFDNVGNDIRRVLNDPKDPFITNDRTTPNTLSAIEDLDTRLGAPARDALDPATKSFEPFTPSRVNNARKVLNSYWRAANNTARATNDYSDVAGMSRVIDAFDDMVDNALRSKRMFNGDGRAVSSAWDAALESHANLRRTFSPQGKGDVVGPVMNKIVGQRDGQAAPANQIDQWTTGQGGTPVLVGRRLQSIFGPDSMEIGAIKQSLWSKAVEPPEGMAPLSAAKKADNIDKLRASELARTHFTPDELSRMRQHAIDLRNSTAPPRPTTDVVGRALDTINGIGGQAATPQEMADTLFGRRGIGDNPLGVKLAQHIKDTEGVDSDAFRAIQEGQMSSAMQGTGRAEFDHAKAADGLDEMFNGRGRAMSDILYAPEQKAIANRYIDTLRQYAKDAALSKDPIERAYARITGRDGGPPATAREVASMLFGDSIPMDSSTRLGLINKLKAEFGEDSPKWAAVKKGMFRHLTDPGEGLQDWTPKRVADRIKNFLNVKAPEVSKAVFSPEERQVLNSYSELMRKLEIPQDGKNWSRTATFMAKTMNRMGSQMGRFIGAGIGRLMFPGLPSPVSEIIGYNAAKIPELIAQRRQQAADLRAISQQMPLMAEKIQQWQKAVAASQKTNLAPYHTAATLAAREAAKAVGQLGISWQGVYRAAAQDQEKEKRRPQDQSGNNNAIQTPARAHGGRLNDSRPLRPKLHPVITGARLARDGNYYLPDASRHGKYLMVRERGRQSVPA